MRRANFAPLEPFHCNGCGKVLGFTSPGEAKRIGLRSHVFCDECKMKPTELTERQVELLDALTHMRENGKTPTFVAAAEMIGVSRTRAQQIAGAIRARGDGDLLDIAMGYKAEPAPEPVRKAASKSRPRKAAERAVAAAEAPVKARAAVGPTNPTEHDPAAFGGEFM